MTPLVTIGVPVYKRLEYLPSALASIQAQDYPRIECLVSDNGFNGTRVEEIVGRHYGKPFRVRKNQMIVGQSEHYNQIAGEASGSYFLLLNDDDEISSNLVSELVGLLERCPDALVAVPKEETFDLTGRTLRGSADDVPEVLSGDEFINAWCRGTYRFETFTTVLARTDAVKACGGYPTFPTGNGIDDALLVKLCLGHRVALSARCVFRKRTDESTRGFACDYESLTQAAGSFLKFLDQDPTIRQYAVAFPDQWQGARRVLVEMIWKTCFHRWNGMYRERLGSFDWTRSAFTMPYVRAYYAAVSATLIEASKTAAVDRVKKFVPWVHRIYRSLKHDIR